MVLYISRCHQPSRLLKSEDVIGKMSQHLKFFQTVLLASAIFIFHYIKMPVQWPLWLVNLWIAILDDGKKKPAETAHLMDSLFLPTTYNFQLCSHSLHPLSTHTLSGLPYPLSPPPPQPQTPFKGFQTKSFHWGKVDYRPVWQKQRGIPIYKAGQRPWNIEEIDAYTTALWPEMWRIACKE